MVVVCRKNVSHPLSSLVHTAMRLSVILHMFVALVGKALIWHCHTLLGGRSWRYGCGKVCHVSGINGLDRQR